MKARKGRRSNCLHILSRRQRKEIAIDVIERDHLRTSSFEQERMPSRALDMESNIMKEISFEERKRPRILDE